MKLFYTLLLMFCVYAGASAQAVLADPSLGQVYFSNADESPVDLPPILSREKIYLLKVPLFNINSGNAIQPGATKIKIGLGSKIVLDPSFNLSATNTSAYFNWSVETAGGQAQLTGDQVAPLPTNYSDTAVFRVKGIILGVSTITANFLVTNHNTGGITLSDQNGANNLSSQVYLISETVPVDFTGIQVSNEECAVAVTFTTANEYNLSRFMIEYSADGLHFHTIGQVQPRGNGQYQYRFNVPADVTGNVIHVRVRSVDIDGRMQYSDIKILRNLCGRLSSAVLYPNPVSRNQSHITLLKNNGAFNGSYTVEVFDATGKKVSAAVIRLSGVRLFKFPVNNLPAGSYTLRLAVNGEAPQALPFQKIN